MNTSACIEIKEQIATLHQQASNTPFMTRLVSGRIDQEEYVTYLRSLNILYSVMETQLSRSSDATICAVWRDEMLKQPLLEQDISALTEKSWFDRKLPIAAALRGAELIRIHCLANPWRLLGYLYVLEGSTNGGVLIYPRVQQALNLPGEVGTAYLRNYQNEQHNAWQSFKNRIDQSIITKDHLKESVAGAKQIFMILIEIMEGFDKDESSQKIHVTALNPEAGSHNVPQLEQEIEAVLIASELAYNKIPYIHARYGERGKKYTLSDGAWLATLPNLPETVVMKQVNWLAKLLSSLGLPRIALELHLQETEKALLQLQPEQIEKYAVLGRAANHLTEQRMRVIDACLQKELIKKFYTGLGDFEQADFLAEILISAKADETIDQSTILNELLIWLDGSNYWPLSIKSACHNLARDLEQI